jgi:hypothetical protein
MLTLTSHDHRPQLAANPRKLRTGMNAHVVPQVGSIVLGLTTDVLLIIGALFGRGLHHVGRQPGHDDQAPAAARAKLQRQPAIKDRPSAAGDL